MAKQLKVEVIGVEPPCPRCRETAKNVEKAVSKIKRREVEVEIRKMNASSKETVRRYGVLVTPSVAVNGVVRIVGRVPQAEEVERILRKAIEE